jgi:hypothetical protein
MPAEIIHNPTHYVNPVVPTGLLDSICTLLACLANDLAKRASRTRTARAARMATAALEAATHVHLCEAALARLMGEVQA